MKRVIIIASVLAVAGLTYFSIHTSLTKEVRAALKADSPELAWLKREYQLNDQQFAKVEALHQSHDVECQRLCRELAKCQKQLCALVAVEPVTSEAFQTALENWRKQQVISQNSILKHMEKVSAEMDAEPAKRYRRDVYQNLILPGRTPHINSNGEFNPEFILLLSK